MLFKRPIYFISALLIFVILGPFARTVLTNNEIWSDHSYLSCMDGIAIGCLAALLSHQVKLNKKMFLFTLYSGLTLFVFIFIFRKQAYDLAISKIGLNVTLLEVGTGLILIVMQEWYAKGKHFGSTWTAPLRWLGQYSYEIYLTHMFFITAISGILFNAKQSNFIIGLWYVIAIVISGICGYAISLYFSEPMNRLIRQKYCATSNVIEETPAENKVYANS